MDSAIFKKLKVKPNMTATLLYTPQEYPSCGDFSDVKSDNADFVHLFVTSQAEFAERCAEAIKSVVEDGLLWVSYPKSDRKNKYDINRDSLWGLVIPLGWHPVAQVSLDEQWSAVRLKKNEAGKIYERPNNVKK